MELSSMSIFNVTVLLYQMASGIGWQEPGREWIWIHDGMVFRKCERCREGECWCGRMLIEMNILCFQLKWSLTVLPISTVALVVVWLRWNHPEEMVMYHLQFMSSYRFVFFSLNRINDFSIACVLPKLRKMWLVLLKYNTKEVNERRQEFISNVGRYGGWHVQDGQVLILWRCIFCSFMASNKLNEEERTLVCSKF